MTAPSVTNTFVAGAVLTAAQLNTNYSDLITYISNRNDGTAAWEVMKVTATTSNPVIITGNQSTTEVTIDNTATDGDPILTFKLSSSQKFVIGIDDSDSDALIGSTTSITAAQWIRIPSAGTSVQLPDGTVSVPGITFIADTNTGIYRSGANALNIVANGSESCIFTSIQIYQGMDGTNSAPSLSWDGDSNTGMYRVAADTIGLTVGGTLSLSVDTSATATHTRMLVYDVDNATLERVTVGIADSGGAGFKVLRIPN